jgi:hypothetical protein
MYSLTAKGIYFKLKAPARIRAGSMHYAICVDYLIDS